MQFLLIPIVVAGGAVVGWMLYRKRGAAKALGPGEDPNTPGPGPGGRDPNKVKALIGSFQDGRFHTPTSGGSASDLAGRVLKRYTANPSNAQRLMMRRILNSVDYNREIYGEPIPEDTAQVQGLSVRRAFMPKHENAVAKLSLGWLPKRQINAAGQRIGPEIQWGALWVPELVPEAIQAGTADPVLMVKGYAEHGAAALEPPAEFWANVQGAD